MNLTRWRALSLTAAIGFAAAIGVAASADAQIIGGVAEGTTTGGLDSFTFSLDPNDQAGTYETVELEVFADAGTLFNQPAGIFGTLGEDDTTFSLDLILPENAGGFAFTSLTNESPTELTGTFARFAVGGVQNFAISTSGVIDFGQVVLPAETTGSGTFTFTAFNNGAVVSTSSGTFGASAPMIPGDFDGDGDVDGGDFGVFVNSFQNSPQGGPPFAPGDFDEDGDVDGGDFGVFVNSFQNFPPEAVAVPEPSTTAFIAAIVGCGWSVVTRRPRG